MHSSYENQFCISCVCFLTVAYPGILFREGGVQQIQLRTEDIEKGDLGAIAP